MLPVPNTTAGDQSSRRERVLLGTLAIPRKCRSWRSCPGEAVLMEGGPMGGLLFPRLLSSGSCISRVLPALVSPLHLHQQPGLEPSAAGHALWVQVSGWWSPVVLRRWPPCTHESQGLFGASCTVIHRAPAELRRGEGSAVPPPYLTPRLTGTAAKEPSHSA